MTILSGFCKTRTSTSPRENSLNRPTLEASISKFLAEINSASGLGCGLIGILARDVTSSARHDLGLLQYPTSISTGARMCALPATKGQMRP